ncbi:hypothetical protein UlMin_031484 [Ulmus minor]
MALLEAKPVSALSTTSAPAVKTTSVFNKGTFSFTSVDVRASSSSSSPLKPLVIVTPTVKGTYPVILFLHGFYLRNNFYLQLLQHISSHGYIVVAPQLYECVSPTGPQEIESAAKVTDWLEEGLKPHLPENVSPDLTKVALTGHSRGGKAAFALALGITSKTSLNFSVLVGIDPVAGTQAFRTKPYILTGVPHSLDLSIPVANCMSPPCAPEGLNHEEFFKESKPPCVHFVAKDYGHMDMLDDDPPGVRGKLADCMCKNGSGSRDPMKRSVGGIVVAFLRAYLGGDDEDLIAIVGDPSLAPAKLEDVQFLRE